MKLIIMGEKANTFATTCYFLKIKKNQIQTV